MVLYIYVNFMKICQTVSSTQSGHEYMVEMAIFNVQRAITSKVGNPVLSFMCSALLYIDDKFHENISNGFHLTERI